MTVRSPATRSSMVRYECTSTATAVAPDDEVLPEQRSAPHTVD
ncbi:hypothetical protein AB0C34_10040 [Nocardia sp. NPDC049220]